MPFNAPHTLTILINTAVSDVLELSSAKADKGENITLTWWPDSALTAATIAWQGSVDNLNWVDILDAAGDFVGVASPPALDAQQVSIPAHFRYLRLRSQNGSGVDTNQAATETFSVIAA